MAKYTHTYFSIVRSMARWPGIRQVSDKQIRMTYINLSFFCLLITETAGKTNKAERIIRMATLLMSTLGPEVVSRAVSAAAMAKRGPSLPTPGEVKARKERRLQVAAEDQAKYEHRARKPGTGSLH